MKSIRRKSDQSEIEIFLFIKDKAGKKRDLKVTGGQKRLKIPNKNEIGQEFIWSFDVLEILIFKVKAKEK